MLSLCKAKGLTRTDLSGAEVFKAFNFNKRFERDLTVFLPLRFTSEIKTFATKLMNMKPIFLI